MNTKLKLLTRGYIVVLAVVTIVVFHAGFALTALYVVKPLFHRLETQRANSRNHTVTNLPPHFTFLPTNYPWAPIGNGLIAIEIPDAEAQEMFDAVKQWSVSSSTNLVDWSYSLDANSRQQELLQFLGEIINDLSSSGIDSKEFFKYENAQ